MMADEHGAGEFTAMMCTRSANCCCFLFQTLNLLPQSLGFESMLLRKFLDAGLLHVIGRGHAGLELGEGIQKVSVLKISHSVENKDRDMTLTKKIIQEELPSILLKSLNTYFGFVDMHRASEFTTWCPPYFRETGTLLHDNNYMYKFLTAGPDDNKSSTHRYYIVHKPGAFANLADVKKMFENYMRFNHRGTNWKWTSDYTPFKQLGFSVIYQNMCKSCGNEWKSKCCDEAHPSNRIKRFIVKDMHIVAQTIVDDGERFRTTYHDEE